MPATDVLIAAREPLIELAPVLRRAVALQPRSVARLRSDDQHIAVLVTLPFDVLVSRTVESTDLGTWDISVAASALLEWLDGDNDSPPPSTDGLWRGGLPPTDRWRRVDTVPDAVIRDLVRAGALAVKDAAARDGVPGAQPRAEVTDALLDAVVLTVTADDDPSVTAAVTLRALSAMTRMGFLARDSHAHVDRSGRWIRLAAAYGSVYLEGPGGLTLAGH